MEEKNKRKDWTKVDVETIKENLPKILIFCVLFIPIIIIGYIAYIGIQNAENQNSGITVENKIYEANAPNATEIKKNLSENNGDISSTSDLLKFMISWLPMIFALFFVFKLFEWFSRD